MQNFGYQKIALGGFIVWLILFTWQFSTLYHEAWARLILALAALVWLPLALATITTEKIILEDLLRYTLLPFAALLAVALFLPTGSLAAILTFPWLIFTILVALRGWFYFWKSAKKEAGVLAISIAHVFLVIGGMWTFADRLGWQPLDFNPAIVLLTGIHFHYAGFIFPLLVGLATTQFPVRWLKTGSWLAILAVPLTAAGITITQLFNQPIVEIVAATTVTLAGCCTSIGYLQVVRKNKITGITRFFWSILALSLLASMTLAFLYAIRYAFLIEWLTIPAMRALHGTLNAVLVSGSGLLGWQFEIYKKEEPHRIFKLLNQN